MSRINNPRIGNATGVAAALLVVFLSGCQGFGVKLQTDPHPELIDTKKEQSLLLVPFFPDDTDQCGPSALASVLAFWGRPVNPVALKNEIYTAHLHGSLSIDLLLAAETAGFKAQLYKGSMNDVKSELKKGRPLVAFVNRGFSFLPLGHYVVITGYDEERQGLYVHTGLSENKFVRYARFLKDWDKTERSTLLVYPPGQEESLHDKT